MENSSVCAVIVTYSDRFNLLKEVIKSCFREGVNKIIVVDNYSKPSSKEKLKQYEEKESRLDVIYLDSNLGSAGGYKVGIKRAYEDCNCDFIWLLDDDNKPLENSLKNLIDYWKNLDYNNKKSDISLLSYRSDRIYYKKAVIENNSSIVLGEKNSFSTIHIFSFVKRVILYFFKKYRNKKNHIFDKIKSGVVSVAPYGGMFFHKNLVDKIGFPNKDFYVYGDDHEWSYKITKNSGEIHIVFDSIIEDIDQSWNVPQKNRNLFQIIANGTPFRVYYSLRNRIVFEKENLVTCKFIYYINMVLFYILLILFGGRENIKIINQSIKDGLNKKMGKNKNINL